MKALTKTNRHDYITNETDRTLMRTIVRYHGITGLQLTKLLYSPKSYSWVQAKLRDLTKAGYLDRDMMPVRQRQGASPLFYTVTDKALTYLRTFGDEAMPERARPYRVKEWSYLYLSHLFACNEVYIAAEQLCRRTTTIRLPRVLHDHELKQQPVYVPWDGGKKRAVIPDGFLDFEVHTAQPYRAPLCIEVDRGTEKQKDFRDKIRALLRFNQGPYQQAYGRQALTICVIACPGAKRLESLLAWTEAELNELRVAEQAADIFRFATFGIEWHTPESARPSPEDIFIEPNWTIPVSRHTVPLLQ